MIQGFRYRGLKRLYDEGDGRRVRPDQLTRIEGVLAHLDSARVPADLDLPGYRLHRLRGDRRGHWSVTISGNWRITFRFEDGDTFDVDLGDYH